MKLWFKNSIKFCVMLPFELVYACEKIYENVLRLFLPEAVVSLGRTRRGCQNDKITMDVQHVNESGNSINLKFFAPNTLNVIRSQTFSTKEPEILKWIEKHNSNATFFDIGANIGLYSIYRASVNEGQVYAFEPSCFNLPLLTKNICINELTDKISIIPIPLTDKVGIQSLKFTSDEAGGALNSFGVDYGFDGRTMEAKLTAKTIGISIDQMFMTGMLSKYPEYIKIDVDGIEDLILEGAREAIRHKNCKSIYIEVNEDFESSSSAIKKILGECGFKLEARHLDEYVANSDRYRSCGNEIWTK